MRFLLFLLLMLWYLFSCYWYVCQIKEHNCDQINSIIMPWKANDTKATANNQLKPAAPKPEPPKPAPEPEQPKAPSTLAVPPLEIKDKGKTIVNSKGNFIYNNSNDKFVGNAETGKALQDLSTYLKSNPDRQLLLYGLYNGKEENKTDANNLGLARANDVRDRLIKQGIPEDQIKSNSRLNNRITFTNDQFAPGIDFKFANLPKTDVAKADTAKTPPPPPPPSFVVRDGKDTVLNTPANTRFATGAFRPLNDPANAKNFRSLGDYLKKNNDRNMSISGYYGKDEQNPTNHPNLGVARAEHAKREILKGTSGVTATRITTKGAVRNNLAKDDKGNIIGGLDFNFSVSEKVAEKLKAESRNLYFESGSNNFKVTPELQKYFRDVKTYLAQSPESNVLLTGHTDNEGESADNQRLGKQRANFVKNQLVSINIDKEKILVASKGETKPIAPNTTAEGRQKNRRVEMIIKDK